MVVFESASPDFFLAHFDLTGKTGNVTTAVGPSGMPILMDTYIRLTKSPVVSIAKIRGCLRGACSEFVLACDMRFASRENTRLGQPEVGVGVNPGGGGTERLPPLVGRGRALEIILGANDFDGETAERYGYVHRALPDAELDGFVDALAPDRLLRPMSDRGRKEACQSGLLAKRRSSPRRPQLVPDRAAGPKRYSASRPC